MKTCFVLFTTALLTATSAFAQGTPSADGASGTHILQLVLGDANHVPHDPPVMSDVITITAAHPALTGCLR